MKIRIKGNTIRIRLTKTEVNYFAIEGYLQEKTDFGKNSFVYALKSTGTGENLFAEFSDGTMTMFIPLNLANEWTETEMVGYHNEMETGDGKKLFLLLEKDYKCLDTVSEDQSDQYENPLVKRSRQ